MGTMRRVFQRLRRQVGWLVPAKRSRAEVEEWMTQIPRDAAILGGPRISAAQLSAERARLRRKVARRSWTAALGWPALVLIVTTGLYLAVGRMELGGGMARAAMFVLCALGAVTLVAIVRALFLSASREEGHHLRDVLLHLGAEGGEGREADVLDWLDRHWPWATPPSLFQGTTYLARGVRRGRPFLILSEGELSSDADWGPSLQRTCAFIAGDGAEAREMGERALPAADLCCHVAVTPAGLFAWWAPASDFSKQSPEWFGAVLDGLLDVADRELGPAREVGPAPNE